VKILDRAVNGGADRRVMSEHNDLDLTLRLIAALVDDDPTSTDLLMEVVGDVRATLRLASMVVGLLNGDTPEEQRASLAQFSLALQVTDVDGVSG
jgi:uncharacterized protein YejL (UPF0352 family)